LRHQEGSGKVDVDQPSEHDMIVCFSWNV
jgi:hypothetical protein